MNKLALHGWTAWVLIYLLGLHLLGVVKHQLIGREHIIARLTGRGAYGLLTWLVYS